MKTYLSLFSGMLRARLIKYFTPVFLFVISSSHLLSGQGAPPLDWQKKFGGNSTDLLTCWIETDDGYLMGGSSLSGISEDKSAVNKGDYDIWIIKTDKNGNKLWDKSYGGSSRDEIDKIIKTTDGGFLLAGNSASGVNNDKLDSCRGDSDFWVIKITADGTKLWDNTIGGNHLDDLKDAIATSDGGFLLGGDSYSDKSADKSEESRSKGMDEMDFTFIYPDYWVVKIDASGEKQWDKTLGGGGAHPWYGRPGYDYFSSLLEAKDGGFIIGGASNSNSGYDKSENAMSQGDPVEFPSYDLWIVKLNTQGQKSWDKVLGSFNDEYLSKIIGTEDGGYLLVGSGGELWKISNLGIRQWQRNHSLKVASAIASPTGYYLAAFSNTMLSLNKYNWEGKPLWTKSLEGSYKYFGFLELTSQEEVFLGDANKENDETNYEVYKLKADPTNYPSNLILYLPLRSSQSGPVDLTIEHAFSSSSISKVEFYANNVKIGEDYTAPYSLSWTNATPGVHHIYAKAIEESGTSFLSLTKPITIFQSGTEFFRAINLNGPASTLDDILFESSSNAPDFTFQAKTFANQTIDLTPATDSVRTNIIRSSLHSTSTSPAIFTFANVSPGTYEVYVYAWEDNYSTTYSLWIEGQLVLEKYNSGNKGNWVKHGPFKTTISDGTIELKASGGDANLSGIEVWRVPGVEFYRAINLNGAALKIDNVNFESSSNALNFAYQAKAFVNGSVGLSPKTDPGRTQMIRSSLYATKTNPATFTFSNVPTGTYDLFVYAWEDNYSQTFSITANDSLILTDYKSGSAGSWRKLGPFRMNISNSTINLVVSGGDANISGIELWKVTGIEFYRAINLNGPELVIDNIRYESGNASDINIYGNSSADESVLLIPKTDSNRDSMIRSGIYPKDNGSRNYAEVRLYPKDALYDIYIYVLEDNHPQDYSISFNNSGEVKNFKTGVKGQWNKMGPFRIYSTQIYGGLYITLTGKTGCTVQMSGLEIWRVTDPSVPQLPQSFAPPTKTELSSAEISISAFPNPINATQKLTIQLTEDYKGKVSLSVINGIGSNYLTEYRELNGEHELSIDLPLNKMSMGLYFLKIKSDTQEGVIRICKE